MTTDLQQLQMYEYRFHDGQWSLPDSFMRNLYAFFVHKDKIFYNIKDLTNWNPLPYFKSVRLWVGTLANTTVGAYWLSTYNPLNKSGFFNCAYTGVFKDKRDTIQMASQGLAFLLSLPDVRTIYGETSLCNKPVLALASYFGFQTLGIVPNGHYHAAEDRWYDTRLMYLNTQTFTPDGVAQ